MSLDLLTRDLEETGDQSDFLADLFRNDHPTIKLDIQTALNQNLTRLLPISRFTGVPESKLAEFILQHSIDISSLSKDYLAQLWEYRSKRNIEIYKTRKVPSFCRVMFIKYLISKGMDSVDALARGIEQFDRNSLMIYSKASDVDQPYLKEVRISAIRQLSGQGCTRDVIAPLVGVTYGRVVDLARGEEITIPRKKHECNSNRIDRREEVEDLLGLTLGDIGAKLRVGKERARQIIASYDLEELQREKRAERLERERRIRLSMKYEHNAHVVQYERYSLEQRAVSLGWAGEMALKHLNLLKTISPDTCTFDDLVVFLQRHQTAKDNGEEIPVERLVEGLGFSSATGGRVLKRLDLDLLCRETRIRNIISQEDEFRIRRAYLYARELPISDISYFIELKSYMISRRFRSWNTKESLKPALPQAAGYLKGFGRFHYRDASEVYRMQDNGASFSEISDNVKKPKKVIQYILKNRSVIGPIIVDSLRQIFANKRINTPYRDLNKLNPINLTITSKRTYTETD